MIAAPRSGAGKTTVTLGLLAALRRRGLTVQPLKCGPDYIDPAFHAAAAGRQSFNVDSWAMRRDTATGLLEASARGADIIIAEALMGLFDGVATLGNWGTGSSADLAELTGWPVALVLDVSGQSQTAAAVARGFYDMRQGVAIAGVILNRVGSERHSRLVSAAMADANIPVFGAIPRQSEIALPERHLGLVQAEETTNIAGRLAALADLISRHVDVDRVIAAARAGRPNAAPPIMPFAPAQRITIARDEAFSFVYPHIIEAWRRAGAEIVPFSPLADEGPDPAAGLCWLPGGYPELHAGRIAAASTFKRKLAEFAATRPVHGECGGYMVLGDGLIDADGERHQMAGLLAVETSYAARKMTLGYRRAWLRHDCVLGPAGACVTGHEFHYSTVVSGTETPLFDAVDADGNAVPDQGSRRRHVTGSYFHLID